MFSWRIAVGLNLIVPIVCFAILFFCPESPVWYMSMNQPENAKLSLRKLRGEGNPDLIQAELDRISLSLKYIGKESELEDSPYKSSILESIPQTYSFWRPLGILVLMFMALHWGGFPALGFYMVSMLKDADIPLDPYWACAIISLFRTIVAIFGSTLNAKCKRRTMYLTCCGIHLAGLSSLATYFYMNYDGNLTQEYPVLKWTPIFSMMIIYTAFAFGYGSIPFILQVIGFIQTIKLNRALFTFIQTSFLIL